MENSYVFRSLEAKIYQYVAHLPGVSAPRKNPPLDS